VLHGDELRKIFSLNGYSKDERLNNGKIFINFLHLLIKQKINIVFAVVGLFDELRAINRKKFSNYVEIYIKTDFKKVIKLSNKKFYNTKAKNVVGLDIEPELPKNPSIIINNTFDNNLDTLVKKLNNKINSHFLIK
tara:strand:- start:349 stop:756 length:408 start_codon:yes stop_codon:yes gene_type:complete